MNSNKSFQTRTTSIQSNSPSTLNLGDPISEKFNSSQSLNKSTPISPNTKGPNYMLYILILAVLAILGLNIFAYLGMLSETILMLFRPIIADIAYFGSETIKQTVNTSAEGSKLGIDVAAGTITDAINLGQKAAGSLEESVVRNKKLKPDVNTKKKQEVPPPPVIPDDIDSSAQLSKSTKKAGFCYIGEDRGFRSCIKVTDSDVCMSGNIFPSQEVCINPSLREGTD